jgi:cyclic beta-1,2-glucan synthetase
MSTPPSIPDSSSSSQLEDLARQLARGHAVTLHPKRVPSLLDRLPEQRKHLRAAYQHFVAASEVELALFYASEWILDNFYLVEQALRQVCEDMPEGYYRQLPKLVASALAGYPRIYAVARAMVGSFEDHLDLDRVKRFLQAYQRVTPLTMGELWALPTMLRLVALELLSQAVTAIVELRTSGSSDALSGAVAGLSPQDLRGETVVANCIISLRLLATQDWNEFFESVSLVEQVLGRDPAGVYARMDFETRDQYRGEVETLARATGRDEEEVAQEAVRLAQDAFARGKEGKDGAQSRTAHVGFYLLDAGRARLEECLGYRPPWGVRLSRWLLDHPTLAYLSGIALLTLTVLLGLVAYASAAGGTLVQLIGVVTVVSLPAMAVAVNLVNWLVTHTVSPHQLPRMDFRKGIPAEYRTMVVLPVLLTNADEVHPLLQQLERHSLSNVDPRLHFALLADLGDAFRKHMPGDEALLDQAKAGVQALNREYSRHGTGPFYLLCRERELNPAEECWLGREDGQGQLVGECWMGWERKRGKLVEFNRLIRGEESPFVVQIGDVDVLSEVKYVITLDADTLLPRDAARRLVATLAHPLNQAVFDPHSGAVVAGYTVLQPRLEVMPTSAARSLFARTFSGDSGFDLYTRAVSDVYQDLFGEGSYAGKGIYDVAAFERSLAGRVPENALLSHDLFEGIQGRAGLVADEVLYEDYPSHYLAYTRRLHRWVRGDWQLLPWLFPKVPREDGRKMPNDLSTIDRWKILDNLRRSLLTPALLALLVFGWLWLPGSALSWTLLGVLVLAMPIFVGLATALGRRLRGASLIGVAHSAWMDTVRWLLALVFLPYEALIMMDAIAATLHRLFISHKRLLQWTTAAHTIRLFGRETKVGLLWQQMWGASLMALALAWLVILANRSAIFVAAPLLLVWLLSPYIAYWISRPVVRKQVPLSDDQRRQLRRLARRIWLYYEEFVGPDDQWLPPDHFQEEPLGLVAHRTSPTNIGLTMLSSLGAYDLGYIGVMDLVLRLRPTFETMSKLERYRGHFLNWYDTRSLRPLIPRYASTVDSGNLAGCLLTLKQGCLAMSGEPVLRWQRWQGLLDTLDVLAELVEGLDEPALVKEPAAALQGYLERIRQQVLAVQSDPDGWVPLLAELGDEAWPELERLLISLVEAGPRVLQAATLHELRIWSERVSQQLLDMRGELDLLLPWLLPLSQPPALFARSDITPVIADAWRALVDALPATSRLGELADVCGTGRANAAQLQDVVVSLLRADRQTADGTATANPGDSKFARQVEEARDWCVRLADELYSARMAAESLLIGLQDLGEQAEAHFQLMDFDFLFDPHRRIFRIGCNVEAGKLDNNHYDLLASEARLSSILAIAKGDVPQSHWLYLARPITRVNGTRTLLSWGGSMFEYLMPPLLMRSYEGTLLGQSIQVAIARQMAYGRQRGVPWGISESGFYRFDTGQHYQYQGFGVPGLGFKRGLGEDLVIAPYASLLALPFQPLAVTQNIARLVKLQMLGRYGFYEAIDYTRSRLPPDRKSATVRSYLAHHQGMSLLALTNYLLDNVMVRRFHADPRVQSAQLLLQEQVPRQAPVETPHPEEVRAVRQAQPRVSTMPWHVRARTPAPQVHVLSNGRYSVLITNAGGGYSGCALGRTSVSSVEPSEGGQGVDLTRWRADSTLDDWGTWIYVKDQESGALWSASYQPTGSSPESQEILFHAHMVEFRRQDHGITVHTEITVSPDDDVEIRRVTLTNHGDGSRRLVLTSCGEVVLAPRAADQRHPAFGKLFVESEHLPEVNGLLFRRRPRSAEQEPIYLAHMLVFEDERETVSAYESDRARFLGRGGTLRSPRALARGEPALSGTTGAVLDPIMALSQEIELRPHASMQVAYVTLVVGSREGALDLARHYRTWLNVGRAFDRARSQSELELHRLNLSTPEVERIQQLFSVLLYPHAALRAAPATLAANSKGQPALWAYGVSGDYPILLVRLREQEEMDLLRELLQAHRYWRDRQSMVDLVILNERETAYDQELHGQIHRLIARMGSDAWLNQRGGIFVLRADQMGETDLTLLETAARAILDGQKGSLDEQLRPLRRGAAHLPRFVPTLSSPEDKEPTPPLTRPTDLLFDNGLGGFSADGREYVIYLERHPELAEGPGQCTPAPWINVIANPHLGFLVSETGSGYTWAGNSSENRLTRWSNDPVADTPGEALYLRDEETAQVWSPTPLPAGAQAPYLIRHGAGYSIFEHHSHGLKQQLRLFAVPDAPVKVIQLRLENTWHRIRRITATFYAEWVLGTTRDITQQYVIPDFDAGTGALLVHNPYNMEFGKRVAFVATSKNLHGLTADRTEFLGREGSLNRPAALGRIGLSGTVRAGLDPCAVLQIHLDMVPGDVQEVYFLIGQGANRQEAIRLVEQYRDEAQVEAAWEGVIKLWDGLLGSVTVQTPDPAMNVLLNRWLLYQALSCRVWGRSALYQSSGAFGYRDQLQDVMALVHAAPEITRAHVLEAARHQFEAGDVLHWWHPPSGRGVRTRCSDDLLWLPFVTAHYVTATGDEAILKERIPFLRSDPLKPEELERYGHYEATAEAGTLYEHCLRALERGTTAGPHGLPLIGSHDWNDGLSRVGIGGKGESVWLGWFLCAALARFAPLCERLGDAERAAAYQEQVQAFRRALEDHAWDGGWYRRAYYDDGTPLGSSESDEARIDSIAQSWAVLSGAAEPQRATQAMESVTERLVRNDDQLILLFTPPFDRTEHDPGYIKGYPPGIRENGGQYTHAALWAVWAFVELRQGDRAEALFRLLNPIYHSDTPEKAARYRVEPYVVAADVYSVEPHVGRGGWTWYTGSAGWMYRLGVEAILGLRRVGRVLQINPCIPKRWPAYEVTYRDGETSYRIRVENPDGVNRGVKQVLLDGETLPGREIPLLDDSQRHDVHVLMG